MTIDDLVAYGADVETGLARCMGNEDVYLQLVGTVVEENAFGRLEAAVAAQDWDDAFSAAHSLKGVLGNLALTPLYEPVHELTELLRPREQVDCSELLAQVLASWQDLRSI